MLILLHLLILQGALAEGANILALLNLPSPSHYIFNRVLMVELAKRGHQVTVVSASAEKHPVANLTNILLEGVYDRLAVEYDYVSLSQISLYDMIPLSEDWGVDGCHFCLNTNGARQLLKHPGPFDLIFVEAGWSECFLGFVHHFGYPPTIALSGMGINPWTSLYMGTPEMSSYVVNFMLDYDPENLGLLEKLNNAALQWYLMHRQQTSYMDRHDALARQVFGQDMPYIRDIAWNISMAFVNTAPGIDPPRPLPPGMVPIGGMHVAREPQPLPKDLKRYLDDAKDGCIFFSLGSNLKSTGLSTGMREVFLEAFRKMAPVRILWKWEDESLSNKPDNVMISKWLPQRDLLSHPNIRAFISHCGRMSTIESVYCGVPVVGVPFFLDQLVNIKKLERLGVALSLDFNSLTSKQLLETLKEVVHNTSYRQNMQELSAVFRDQPDHPLDRAVFWTEYVLRHGHKTSKIMKPISVSLSWYEYFLLDVLIIVFGVVISVIALVILLLSCIWRTLVGKSTKKAKTQ